MIWGMLIPPGEETIAWVVSPGGRPKSNEFAMQIPMWCFCLQANSLPAPIISADLDSRLI